MIGRYKSVLLVLFGVLAFSAVVTASASATEATVPEWLESGAKIPAAGAEVTAEGELLLEDMNPPGGPVDVLCSGFLDGLVFPGGIDRIDEALALDKVSKEIECSFILPGACEPAMAPLVVAENLPWKTELILDEPGVTSLVVDLIKKEAGVELLPAYLVNCLVAGVLIDDLCEGESSFDVVNNGTAGDVEATFSHTDELVTGPVATCALGGVKTGLIGSEDSTGVVVPSLITLNSGLTLSISEDGL